MGTKDHFISQFHLRQFIDPDALGEKDPWLWQGSISNERAKRRAPKNVGFKPSMFDGPGGLADPTLTLEKFLAAEVEGSCGSCNERVQSAPTAWWQRSPS